MNLHKRIEVLGFLGEYLQEDSSSYQELRYRAYMENKWFTPEYIFQSGKLIASQMLNKDQLSRFASAYGVTDGLKNKTIGLVMAGTIRVPAANQAILQRQLHDQKPDRGCGIRFPWI
jgi:hypothetical protein